MLSCYLASLYRLNLVTAFTLLQRVDNDQVNDGGQQECESEIIKLKEFLNEKQKEALML